MQLVHKVGGSSPSFSSWWSKKRLKAELRKLNRKIRFIDGLLLLESLMLSNGAKMSKVGQNRRLRDVRDVVALDERRKQVRWQLKQMSIPSEIAKVKQNQALEELVAHAQEVGMGY